MDQKQKAQKLDFIFVLPGNASSAAQWLGVHTAMMNLMMVRRKTVGVMHSAGCNIYGVRNRCLSLGTFEKNQKPIGGIDYKHLVWVDSDNYINVDQVLRLASHDKDIVAGWYLQKPNENTSGLTACGFRSMEYFKEEDKLLLRQPLKKYSFNRLFEKDILTKKDPFPVDYAGMGLMVMKKGVMESLEYPWFMSWVVEWEEKGVQMAEIITDDDGLCIRLQEKGFEILIDPMVRVGHEKGIVL